jgi:hypothetical protein
MTELRKLTVNAFKPSLMDAFMRQRVSEPQTIFDSKQLFDNAPLFWDESLESGAGISSAHSTDTASTVFTSTLSTAGTFTRQTFMRFNYQPGKGQLIFMTGILDRSGGGTGVQRRIGYFDDENGLFFEDDEGTVKVVRRTYVTGSAVDNKVAQSSWDDPMDGTGESGVTIDWTKTQIFGIAFEWLGVGSVQFFMVVDGNIYIVHTLKNANVLDKVYMSTPNLPLRYQMITTGSSPASTMECICSSVMSEGGQDNNGVLLYVSTNGTHVDCATENTIYAIIGIRLKSTHLDATVDIEKLAIQIQTASDTGEWTWRLNPTVQNTFTYSGLTNSAIEYATGGSTNTVTGGTVIDGGFAHSSSAGAGGAGSARENVNNAIRLGAAIDGTVDEMVLCWMPTGGTTNNDIEGSIHFRELS